MFKPHTKNHAIFETVVVLDFTQEFSSEFRGQIKENFYNKNSDNFNSFEPILGGSFNLKDGVFSAQTSESVGFRMADVSKDGITSKFVEITPNALIIRQGEYTDWKSFKAVVTPIIKAFFSLLPENDIITFNSMRLEVADRFYGNSETDGEVIDLNNLLNADSKFLNKIPFQGKDAWHIHTGGYIDLGESEIAFKVIEQLNMDAMVENGLLNVVIRNNFIGFPQYAVSQAMLPMVGDSFFSLLDLTFDIYHLRNKQTLQNILVNDMQNAINLNES